MTQTLIEKLEMLCMRAMITCTKPAEFAKVNVTDLRAIIEQHKRESACQYGKDVGMPQYSCAVKCQYEQPSHTQLISELVEALMPIGQRFVSGNDVPVSRATVPAEDWAVVDALLTKVRAEVK